MSFSPSKISLRLPGVSRSTPAAAILPNATCMGLSCVLEAVRQVRGTSTNQAPRNDVAMVIGGPMVTPVSNLLLGSDATL